MKTWLKPNAPVIEIDGSYKIVILMFCYNKYGRLAVRHALAFMRYKLGVRAKNTQ